MANKKEGEEECIMGMRKLAWIGHQQNQREEK